jgi:hypothetical protein
VCEHHIDSHGECIRDDAKAAVGAFTPNDTTAASYPQRDRLMSKLLYASIFHPPQAK